ncbi:MAG TPA: sulfurtransferase [Planococcus sp. (in: firmicutes)]|nr:sulfurtransferase [Planococcus sp. (in: firmicutes)]
MKVFIDANGTENYRWIDARFDLKDPQSGKSLYEKGHVEGAIYWDLEEDLSDMASTAGRHPMPNKDKIAELIHASGLNLKDQVVVYDQGGAPFAARAWWLLKYAGFENAFISRLGFDGLKQQGIKVSTEVPIYERTETAMDFKDPLYADQDYVKKIISGDELGVLVDARSAARYAGIEEPIDPVAGRIPGARNFDWEQLVEDRRFKGEVDFSGVLQKHEPAIIYCGSGVSAAALYAKLSEQGHDAIKLYTGSFSDWIIDESNVVEFDREDHPKAANDETKAILARLIEEGYSGEMLMKKFEYEKSLLNEK